MTRSEWLGLGPLRGSTPAAGPGCLLVLAFLIGFALSPWLVQLAPALIPWVPGIPKPLP